MFAGLMGVLGTIVGFYFGSGEKPLTPLQIAALKVADKQLVTYVSGGSRPYRYSIKSSEADFKQIDSISDEGWIIEPLSQLPKAGSQITLTVTDSKDSKETKNIDFPATKNAQQQPEEKK